MYSRNVFGENTIAAIPEKGLKELVTDAENYYRDGNKQIAVEKLWDAFERLKTYYSRSWIKELGKQGG